MPQVKIWGDGNAQRYVIKEDYDALHKLANEMAMAMEGGLKCAEYKRSYSQTRGAREAAENAIVSIRSAKDKWEEFNA